MGTRTYREFVCDGCGKKSVHPAIDATNGRPELKEGEKPSPDWFFLTGAISGPGSSHEVKIVTCSRNCLLSAAGTAADKTVLHYVVVREDLPRGVQAAMIHAAGESSPGGLAVALSVPDEAAMARLADRLEAAGIALTRVFEPDPPWSGALMAIDLLPARKEALRRHLSMLPLLK